MNKRAPYARIAITLPEADLAAADRLACEWDRSRSWVIAEALRRLVAGQPPSGQEETSAQRPGLGESRLTQLHRDLLLTPEQRVLLAEETLLNAPATAVSPPGPRFFDRYEDFLDWKQYRSAAP